MDMNHFQAHAVVSEDPGPSGQYIICCPRNLCVDRFAWNLVGAVVGGANRQHPMWNDKLLVGCCLSSTRYPVPSSYVDHQSACCIFRVVGLVGGVTMGRNITALFNQMEG